MRGIGAQNPFSDTSVGGVNINWVKIEWSLHSKHLELRPLWVRVVNGWVGVASHHVELLSRISPVRFLLSSCSSFETSRWCRSYFRIWKHRSNHTTEAISSWVRLIIGHVNAWMVELCRATFLQWTVGTTLTDYNIFAVDFTYPSSMDCHISKWWARWAACTKMCSLMRDDNQCAQCPQIQSRKTWWE
jgi:hypothetical protein